MSQATWAQIEAAIQASVATASGLSTIWRYQAANQPALDYVGLSLGAVTTVGVDFIDESYDLLRPPHERIALTVGGTREVQLQIEVWSSALVEALGQATALSIVDAIVTKMRLPLMRNALRAVGVTPFDPGPANWLPSIVAVGFRGHAVCNVRCRMPARALVEYADYIASISVAAEITGPGDIDVTIDAP